MAILTNRETYDPHPEDAWRRLKMRRRKPIELAVLHRSPPGASARRASATSRGRVIKDDAIYEIAQQQPRDEAALGGCAPRRRAGNARRPRPSLLGAINAALAMPKDELPKLPKPAQNPEGSNAAAELLKVLLRLVAEEEGVAPKVLASSDEIDRLAADGEKPPTSLPFPAGGAKCSAKGR
jgi:ribonuclease D